MAYLGNSPGVASQRIVTTFTATAGQTTFTPSSGYALGYCDVFLNGVKLVNGDDYTAANGTTVVLASGASAGDSVEVVAFIPRGLSDGYTKAEADTLLAAKQNSLGFTPVNKAGDTMTGGLVMGGNSRVNGIDAAFVLRKSSNVSGRLYQHFQDSSGSEIGWVGFGGSSGNQFNVVNAAGTSDADLGLMTGGLRRLIADQSGRVTMPFQPSFLAFGSKSHPGGSWIVVSDGFTSERYDTTGSFNTSNGRFTAPAAGRYFFYAGGYTSSAGNGERYAFSAVTNGGSQDFISGGNLCLVDSPLSAYSVVLNLSAGDYVDLRMYSAAALTIGAGAHTAYFGGYLLG